ncbi:DUF2272 domain-containing protein [Oecophyllibacter saccharovorans]|uniref:DUF2272 domain-containing protein n=1 Tax=Oecophyllibacter saccharovorans TaxID=2558360 RepID=A0A506ULT2_9PROT|nr:DUF2272 domain-containing protein [Oecophyllibacter saccharovorans]QDH15469.1 DUF2272 domain-containing protein [Oecophyllibacter saccharovorans]TPW34304.1 DUF2272 domain-containing protein [Oecophyllibacter saccharovorans]
MTAPSLSKPHRLSTNRSTLPGAGLPGLGLAGLGLAGLVLLPGCTPQPQPAAAPARTPMAQYSNGATGAVGYSQRVPDFATRNFTPFNRQDAAAIALREWRLFGTPVADEDPHNRPEPSTPAMKPERLPGLWQRVGEYWWIGQDPYENEASYTGRTTADGQLFDAAHDGNYAWSAAFISYVMRVAGANDRFAYSPNHATYINAAASGSVPGLGAQNPATYAPRLGDLLCVGRGRSANITYSMLPTPYGFPAHCGIVVSVNENGPPFGRQLSIVGGNVDDTVALTHVPTDGAGRVSDANGQSYDSRYPWLTVLTPGYEADQEPDSGY